MRLDEYVSTVGVSYFADQLGVTKGCVYHYLNGRRRIRARLAEKIEEMTHGKLRKEELVFYTPQKKKYRKKVN